ncbi:unnamed protein product, partial [Schistosoma curassoni]|uniref:Ovule protein n=1 Tax=Schistosoma curassoni TaxID=6186 RepID=A0A183L796_9TREM
MDAGNQQSVHTPFIRSPGSESPFTPLVWNQGFPTTLGGSSISIDSGKVPDTRFSSSQFCKQHPHHEKAV